MHTVMTGVTEDVPQWSPPVSAGHRVTQDTHSDQIFLPQWSPPLTRREYPVPARHQSVLREAAMEPPLNGGSMQFAFEGLADDEEPQWSPPSIGGSIMELAGHRREHGPSAGRPDRAGAAAMEPAAAPAGTRSTPGSGRCSTPSRNRARH